MIPELLLCATFASPLPVAQAGYPKLAPFDAVRWVEDSPEIRVDGTWFGFLAIDGVPATEIVDFCQETWPDRWRKRVTEDLVEALTRMGHEPEVTVDLLLVDLASGEEVDREGVRMTRENRDAARDFDPSAQVLRVEREHAESVAKAYAFLADLDYPVPTGRVIPKDAAKQDLDQLEWILENQFSYLRTKGVDYRAAFDALRVGIDSSPGGVERAHLVVQLMKLVGLFGDGHTRVEESLGQNVVRGYAPFLLGDTLDGVAAFDGDRSALLDAEHPYLVAIDGLELQGWIEPAARLEAQGSPQFRRRQGLRNLRYLAHLRAELGREPQGEIELTLADASGARKKLTVPLVDRGRPIYGSWPRTEHARLEGDIGYLRIPEMTSDGAFLMGLSAKMAEFRDTRGLVIDVRGNGGGSRDALRVLFPYFMSPKDAPHVANVAAYRMRPGDPADRADGYLENRALYPVSASAWSDDERESIRTLAASFRPEWRPAESEFSDWHYFVLGAGGDGAYHYPRPVVVLMDTDCYSATDIFLGAFAGWRDVTLLGEASGGGSGRSQTVALANSGIRLRVSSMASFRPDGSLYDGNGIEPDVVQFPIATDFIGETDSVLDAALERLR